MENPLIFLTALLTLGSTGYYIVTVFRGQTKPHIYSWIVWAIINVIGASIQLQHGSGWGALTLGLGAFVNTFVALISIKYGEKNITRFDTVSFIIALITIPLWLWAKQDLLSMILLVSIDTLSYFPTIRKSFHKPKEENIWTYVGSCLCFLISLPLIREINLINLLYPVTISVVNFGFVGYILIRRKIVKS